MSLAGDMLQCPYMVSCIVPYFCLFSLITLQKAEAASYTALISSSTYRVLSINWAFQVVLVVKNPPANAGDKRDMGLIPELGRSPEGGHRNPLQHSCLENPMDRGAW